MEYKHGCVLLHHGKIISTGYNYDKIQYKNKLLCYNTSCSTHAEMAAILSLKRQKADTLLVIRVGKDGTLRDSKPCQFCYQFIYKNNIKKIYYSTNNQDIVFTKLSRLNCDDLKISRSNRLLKNNITFSNKLK
jgi:deoxycytidylate deaminase